MNPYPPPTEQSAVTSDREKVGADRSLLSLGASEGQTLQHFIRNGKKYIWLVATCAVLGAGAGMITNMTSPKEYSSTATMEITQETASRFGLDTSGYDSGYIDVTRLDTEVAILKSSTLAIETIRSLKLQTNKDFLPIGSAPQWDLIQHSGAPWPGRPLPGRSFGRPLWTYQYPRPDLYGAQS